MSQETSVTSISSVSVPGTSQITFQDLGITTTQVTRKTIFGKVQTCNSLKTTEVIFLALSIISFIISLGLTIQRLITLEKSSEDYTFAILLLVTTAFCVYYAIDGVFLERPYEILVCVCSTIIVIIYCVLNFAFGTSETLKLVRMSVALVLGPIISFCGIRVALEYQRTGDLIYRTVGANLELQRSCSIYFGVSSLLGLDLQLGISMLIFVMKTGTELGLLEKIILAVGIPFSILWLVLGCLSMRLENKILSGIFMFFFWAEPAYVIYKFNALNDFSEILRYSIIACGSAALIVRISLLICFIFSVLNFGKGLKEKVYGT